ncbi:MAG TPA: metallophosphoesterase family protein [Candidatus Acidoferrales bacterium]|nr:metallophosphoesterase family protein [Candidatus Acidoferrales bacterium]
MKVAIISDLHANWQAFEAVLEDLPKLDEVICLGDVVGYGADPIRCLDEVVERKWLTMVGNHDRACTDPAILAWFNDEAATVIRWTVEQLGKDRLDWLKGLPETRVKRGVLLLHASPRDPIYEYVLDVGSARANLALLEDKACFHGHTHLPGIFQHKDGAVVHSYRLGLAPIKGPMLINPGSVGQPRDGVPEASYGIWDTEADRFEFRRLPYDVRSAQRAILKAGLPDRFAQRLEFGR